MKLIKYIVLIGLVTILLTSCGEEKKAQEKIDRKAIDIRFELSAGEYEKAIAILQPNIDADTALPQETIDYVTAIIESGKDFEKAKSLLQKLSNDKEYLSEMYRLQGNIKQKQGQLEAAKKLYLQSFETKKDNQNTLMALGYVEQLLGNIDESLAYLNQAVRYGEATDILSLHLGESYYIKGDDESLRAARTNFENVIRTTKNKATVTKAAHNLGMVYFKAGNYDKAEGFIIKALEFNEKYYPAQLQLGRVFLEKFKREVETDIDTLDTFNSRAAIGELTKAIQLNENATMGYVYLGDIYQILGNKEYKVYYKKALEVIENDSTISASDKKNITNTLTNNI